MLFIFLYKYLKKQIVMIYEHFKWTPELKEEFSKTVLDNYELIDDIEQAIMMFIKSKVYARK
jgi:hypothetical protein